jgi:hypothetical protein
MASAVAEHAAMDETITLLKAVDDAVEREVRRTQRAPRRQSSSSSSVAKNAHF